MLDCDVSHHPAHGEPNLAQVRVASLSKSIGSGEAEQVPEGGQDPVIVKQPALQVLEDGPCHCSSWDTC